MLARLPNPADARAPLLSLTRRARVALRALGEAQVEWAEEVAAEVPPEDLETTLRTLSRLRAVVAQPRLL
jgi:DNA-binding MarR family transcriptional regulator